MDGPGTISWEEFLENAETFVRVSDAISDGWEIRGDKSIPGQAYLYRQTKTFVPTNYLTSESQINVEEESEFEEIAKCYIEDPFEASYDMDQPLVTEHHVLWSMSYGVPVIYFNAWLSGANPVKVDAAQKLQRHQVLDYSELSQAMHPIVGKPFLQLHPCKSEELLINASNSNNKLVSWLSAVAPAALNLKISLDYCKLTTKE